MPVAVVTGASRGLGRAVALSLAARGWDLVVDARTPTDLEVVAAELDTAGTGSLAAIAGSVADPGHRHDIAKATRAFDGLDLLVNNASTLGASPLPRLADYPLETLRKVYDVNVIAPLALTQDLLAALRASPRGVIVNVTSDAAVEPYDGWGGYGSSKAALDQLTAVLAAEEPDLHVYAFDPGDMRTQMHQDAFPGEDISDRPPPEAVVPALLRLLDEARPSGRYQASRLLSDVAVA